ncbi:MAG: alpha/beta fold hydrolase [Elusimicrobia bacterium]|nr:alpha/beta fold hydrolase [Elusimicrobiota bacterium]
MRIFIFLCALFSSGAPVCAQQKTVRFTTPDGCRLEAFYLAPSSGAYVFINAHGLGSDKNEWGPFQQKLKGAGYGYLSLDLRGHGKSGTCGGKEVRYMYFSEAAWNGVSLDIETAAAWLKKRGLPPQRMIYCGASVGANLALKAAAEGGLKPAALILLSPGLEYAGVRAENYFSAPREFRLLSVAARSDLYAWESVLRLNRAAMEKGLSAYSLEAAAGHGVNMFKTPSVVPAILAWVEGR